MKHLIIGNGVAGTTAAKTIRQLDGTADITILSEEHTSFYSRIRLIEYLAGKAGEEDIVIHDRQWHENHNINLFLDMQVSDIDQAGRQVVTESGERFGYDRLLLATGGKSFIPPISGADKKGVFTLRNIHDADEILGYAEGKKRIIMIGGGVLGLEAGNSLRKRGYEIIVVEFFPRLLPRQMDIEGAQILKEQMEGMGFAFYLGAKTKEISGKDRVEGVLLEDGTFIEGDMVIVSAGIRPRKELAEKLGLEIKKGVNVNDKMQTKKEDIYAAGDLVEHRGRFYGIWHAARAQGEIAGKNMSGGKAVYEGTTMSNILKVVDIDLAAAGDIDAEGKFDSIVRKDRERFIYKKIVLKNDIISGCIFYGDISGFRKVLKAIDEQKNIKDVKDSLEKWDLSVL